MYSELSINYISHFKKKKFKTNGPYSKAIFIQTNLKCVFFQGAMLLRHHNEAESLHAVQKLDWEWKMKELALCDMKTSPVIDDIFVPMVHVSDDFDLLPA